MPKGVQSIRELAARRIRQVLLFHCAVMAVFTTLQLVFSSYVAIVPVVFVSFCNTVCLAERCWAIQRSTLEVWPLVTQAAFLVSRLIIVGAILFVSVLFVLNC